MWGGASEGAEIGHRHDQRGYCDVGISDKPTWVEEAEEWAHLVKRKERRYTR